MNKLYKNIFVFLLSSITLCENMFAQSEFEKYRYKSVQINDSTNFVDITDLGIRVTYPRLDSNWDNPKVLVYHSIYTLGLCYDSLSINFVTRKARKTQSDSVEVYYERNKGSGDDYPPVTREDFLKRLKQFYSNTVGGYFIGYDTINGRKFGVETSWSELDGGRPIEFYTYIDSFEVSINTFYMSGRYDSLFQAVTQNVFREYGVNNKSIRMADELLGNFLRRRSINTIKKIFFKKITMRPNQALKLTE